MVYFYHREKENTERYFTAEKGRAQRIFFTGKSILLLLNFF